MKKVAGWTCIILGILGTLTTSCIVPLGELGLVSRCPWLRWFPGLLFFMLYPPSFLVVELEVSDTIAPFVFYVFYLPLLMIGIVLARDKSLSSKWKLITRIFILGYIVIGALTIFMMVW